MIHQCAEESAHKRKDNCHDIIIYLYWIIAEFFTQWLISKVLYKQSLHTVRYITYNSCAISVVPPFNRLWAQVSAW